MGAVFKKVREERGISQKKLSRLSGYDHSFISRIEGGTRNPSRKALHDFLVAMEVDYPETYDRVMDAFGYVTKGHMLPVHPIIYQANELARLNPEFIEDLNSFMIPRTKINEEGEIIWMPN